jgi:hypothetical protein
MASVLRHRVPGTALDLGRSCWMQRGISPLGLEPPQRQLSVQAYVPSRVRPQVPSGRGKSGCRRIQLSIVWR